MTQTAAGRFRRGETGLIVAVPEAEQAVGSWRRRFDPGARAGMPAHITIVWPFLDLPFVDEAVLAALTTLFSAHSRFDVELPQCRRFPGVLYLAPLPEAPLQALTSDVARRWPEAPPYGGRFAEVIPHLTVAELADPEVLDAVEGEVAPKLPVRTRVSTVQLIAFGGERWSVRHAFALAAPPVRRAARVVLLDPDDNVLLMRYDQPPPNGRHWATPGGGADDGEDYAAAALRELGEETGWTDITLGPEILRRDYDMAYAGTLVHQDERMYLARTSQRAREIVGVAAMHAADGIAGWRWWSLAELDGTAEQVWPPGLADLIRRNLS